MGGECPECGRELNGDEKFCPGCACDLTSVHPSNCPECGYDLSGDERYCPGCAHDLDAQAMQKTNEEGADETSLVTTRRAALGMLGIGAVGAGGGWIAAQIRGTDSAAAPPRTDTPSETPSDTSDTPSETPSETETETSTATTEESTGSQSSGNWPMFCHDLARSGYNPDASGVVTDPTTEWQASFGSGLYTAPVVAGDTLYIGAFNGKLYALDVSDGSERWVFSTEDLIRSDPIVVDGVVYFASHDQNVYAVDAGDGSQLWRSQINGTTRSSPAVASGKVYIGSNIRAEGT